MAQGWLRIFIVVALTHFPYRRRLPRADDGERYAGVLMSAYASVKLSAHLYDKISREDNTRRSH
jgi:hypothetical protein